MSDTSIIVVGPTLTPYFGTSLTSLKSGKVPKLSWRVSSAILTMRVRALFSVPGGLNATWPSDPPLAIRKTFTPTLRR